MATYVYDVSPYFPVGATVGAYLRSSYPQSLKDSPDGVAAPIAATQTAVVSSTGTVSYSGLADGVEYWLGTGSAPYDYVNVRTATPAASGGRSATVIETVNTVAASGTAQTLPDVTSATVNRVTLTGNCTFTFPTAAAGKSFAVVLVQDGTGSRTVTWPGTVLWAGGLAPSLTPTAGKRDVFSFLCADGTNWLGFIAGQNF